MIIVASVVIPITIFGILSLASPPQITTMPLEDPPPSLLWMLEYDGTQESFPTESLGQKICDISDHCKTPTKINLHFYDDLVTISGEDPESTLENFYGEKVTSNTVFMEVQGTWHDEDDRLKIKQLIEEIPGVSDLKFKGDIMQ